MIPIFWCSRLLAADGDWTHHHYPPPGSAGDKALLVLLAVISSAGAVLNAVSLVLIAAEPSGGGHAVPRRVTTAIGFTRIAIFLLEATLWIVAELRAAWVDAASAREAQPHVGGGDGSAQGPGPQDCGAADFELESLPRNSMSPSYLSSIANSIPHSPNSQRADEEHYVGGMRAPCAAGGRSPVDFQAYRSTLRPCPVDDDAPISPRRRTFHRSGPPSPCDDDAGPASA